MVRSAGGLECRSGVRSNNSMYPLISEGVRMLGNPMTYHLRSLEPGAHFQIIDMGQELVTSLVGQHVQMQE